MRTVLVIVHGELSASVSAYGCTQKGFTALHTACQEGHLKVAESLITAHASVNAQSEVSVLCEMKLLMPSVA